MSRSFFDDILGRVSLADYFADQHGLTTTNDKLLVCPFHPGGEATMQLDQRAHPETFVCLICSASGDVIDAVRHSEDCDAVAAAEWLDERYDLRLGHYA